ncbi:MAG: holo-ACP synthase [Nocardioidaceae bacterium]|nr:holo-ACP synthase [Nocardioidaceae bacterium]
MPIGIGTDIVLVSRVTRLVGDGGTRFLERWFTPEEIAYCRSKAHPERHFAGRLAAKEATFKALGGDSERAVPWLSLAIVDNPRGAPSVRLSGDLSVHARRLGIDTVKVSLAHCEDYATATAIAVTACGQHSGCLCRTRSCVAEE